MLKKQADSFELSEAKSMLFEESCPLGAEELLFASEGAEFLFEVFLCAGEMFELKPKPPLQITLLSQQCLAFLFHFLAKPLLFRLHMLPELLTLSLQFLCLMLKLANEVVVLLLTFRIPKLDFGRFFRQSLSQEF